MRRKMMIVVLVAMIAIMMIASTVSAAVTFDASGSGFVGKGDVQTMYGWNNKQMNDRAGSISFKAEQKVTENYVWECVSVTKQGEKITERSNRVTTFQRPITTTVTRDNKTGNVTGFSLKGSPGTSTTSVNGAEGCTNNSDYVLDSYTSDPDAPTTTEEWLYVNNGSGWKLIGYQTR
jgi:hypothetical protein